MSYDLEVIQRNYKELRKEDKQIIHLLVDMDFHNSQIAEELKCSVQKVEMVLSKRIFIAYRTKTRTQLIKREMERRFKYDR